MAFICSDQDKDAGARKADPSQEKTDGDVNTPASVAIDQLNVMISTAAVIPERRVNWVCIKKKVRHKNVKCIQKILFR